MWEALAVGQAEGTGQGTGAVGRLGWPRSAAGKLGVRQHEHLCPRVSP